MDVNGELKLELCLTVLRFIIVAAHMAGTQTTHTHYFSLPPHFLRVNTSFAFISAVIWPLPIAFKATAVKLAAFVLLGFHLCTYDERERVAELLRRHEASQVLWLVDFPAAVT